jgi:nitroimidazol reductase NimA-like FMN-containing flavoprotein (pyridoxamine 5'-phosphate oxidase superfamily)
MALDKSQKSRIKRIPERGHYDRETIYAILDQGMICHVGIAFENEPIIIPTLYGRLNHEIVLHGAKASRLLKHVQNGHEVCVAVTLIDDIVLARSVFHHSVNYRSVVVFGKGRKITNKAEKLRALEAISEKLIPGRWEDARNPNEKELDATNVVAIQIEEASAKIRTGPPKDDEEDYELPVWAGLVPLEQRWGVPVPDPELQQDIRLPDYIKVFASNSSH